MFPHMFNERLSQLPEVVRGLHPDSSAGVRVGLQFLSCDGRSKLVRSCVLELRASHCPNIGKKIGKTSKEAGVNYRNLVLNTPGGEPNEDTTNFQL